MRHPEIILALGLRVKQLRAEKKWSQQTLADVANVTKITLQRIELGKVSARLDIIASIASALDVPLVELLKA